MAGINLKQLAKSFGPYTAVSGIDLEIPDGEFLIMVGPSGCGKTTTLNMISGLETPSSGEIWIGERIVNDLEPGERGLGMVFQDLALFPHMTVFENIAFGLRVKKVGDPELTKRVTAAADAMHIGPLLTKLPRQCSGGESQRVALARTIVTNPSVFLMDEPLSSLDAKLRVDMRTELKRLHALLKSTFVYVTHDQAEAMTMADRIVVMSKGRIEQLGTPLEIYDRPATQFVAGFFGTPTMNFLEGAIEAAPAGAVFRSGSLEVRVPLPSADTSASRNVTLGVRSEHVTIADASPFAGTARLLEPLGDATLVHFDAPDGRSLVAKVPPGGKLAPGAPIRFGFDAARCHIFDAATHARVN